jgi:hypothetical protein
MNRKPKTSNKRARGKFLADNVSKTRSGQTTLTSGPIGYPDRVRTTLLYCDTLTISGTAQQYTYRANSLFDPDYTSAGHQPFYYDQYIAVYERYRVYAAKIFIRVLNLGSDVATMTCIPCSLIPTITSLNQALELPRSVSTGPLPPFGYYKHQELNLSASTREICGLTAPQLYDADFAAQFSASPVELWYYALYFSPQGSSTLNMTVQIRLEFQCEFFDRAPVSLSFSQIQLLRATDDKDRSTSPHSGSIQLNKTSIIKR